MKFIPQAATLQVARHILKARKASPQVMFAAGIGGVVVSAVLACRATLKLEKTLDITHSRIQDVKDGQGRIGTGEYTDKEYKKDLVKIYAVGTLDIVKLYGPSVVVGAASLGLLTGSHVTLNRRNAGLTAAYAATQKAFDEYRERVRAELGEEKERDLRHGIESKEVTVDGKKRVQKIIDPNKIKDYCRIFDEYNGNWRPNPELNFYFLKCQQNYLNHVLQARGHVFLNEVYDALGFDHSSAGAVVGWVIGPDGDNYIDFGLFEPRNAEFVNGLEGSILLDFNVDGVIFDKI